MHVNMYKPRPLINSLKTKMLVSTVILLHVLQLVASSQDKVQVGLYAESLCGDCVAFSSGPMNDAYNKVGSIFTLHYIPWGNAQVAKNGSFECQHGPMECVVNTIEACAFYYYPNQSDFWPFVFCMDQHLNLQDPQVAQSCAQSLSMKWDLMGTCYSGDLGHDLELMYANETASLHPPHQYTPWVTINGKHSKEAEGGQLVAAICDAYQGPDKPAACTQ